VKDAILRQEEITSTIVNVATGWRVVEVLYKDRNGSEKLDTVKTVDFGAHLNGDINTEYLM
jgi:hypothetical protein